jgi:hypothetical protein
MARYLVPLAILAISGVLPACGGGGGGAGGDVRTSEIGIVIKDASTTDLGGDPGTDPGTHDPGTADPGTPDPGAEDPGKADPGVEDVATDVPAEDPAASDPGEPEDVPADVAVEETAVDVPHVDPGATDPGAVDPGATDPGAVDTATDPGTDGGFPPTPVGSCRWLYECADPCEPAPAGQDCIDACLGQLTTEGSATLDTLQTCLSDHACFGKTDAEFSACIDAFCLEPYLHCFSGDSLQDCVALEGCMDGCPDDAVATPAVDEHAECVSSCLLNATFDANWAFEMLRQCGVGACPGCLTAETADEIAACNSCWGDAQYGTCAVQYQACAVFGTDMCKTVWQCANTCGVEGCSADCFDQGTIPAQKLFRAIIGCVDAACPDDSDPDAWLTCANDALNGVCSSDYDACQADAGACTPACDGRFCGADGCGGQCGTCRAGATCGTDGLCHTGAYPDLCAGEDTPSADTCPGGLGFEGCCDGKGRVVFCNGGKLYCVDCPANAAPGNTCGWQPDDGSGGDFYNCGETGSDPAGTFPLACVF